MEVQFLLQPTNGPDDFCYTVNQAVATGRNKTLRYGKQWLASGKRRDQKILTDVKCDEEIRVAAKKAGVQYPPHAGKPSSWPPSLMR